MYKFNNQPSKDPGIKASDLVFLDINPPVKAAN